MDLPTAQLGSAPSIQMGGYVPAPAYRPRLTREMLQAFLTGAGGAAGQNLTQAAFTPDMSAQMNADPQLVAQGLAPGPRSALQRFFQPMSREELDKAKALAQTGQYQQLMGGLEKQRVGIEGQRAATEKAGEESEAAQRLSDVQLRQKQLGQEASEFSQRLPLEQLTATSQAGLSGAQTANVGAETQRTQDINAQLEAQQDQAQIAQMEKNNPNVDNLAASSALKAVGTPSQYRRNHPNTNPFDYENAFISAAQAFNKARAGNAAPAVQPKGLGDLITPTDEQLRAGGIDPSTFKPQGYVDPALIPKPQAPINWSAFTPPGQNFLQ